jgi:hypothetical protein
VEQIKVRIEELRREHAELWRQVLWRQVSMSDAFRRLQHVEGALVELERLVQVVNPNTDEEGAAKKGK